eukprot:g31086.t1
MEVNVGDPCPKGHCNGHFKEPARKTSPNLECDYCALTLPRAKNPSPSARAEVAARSIAVCRSEGDATAATCGCDQSCERENYYLNFDWLLSTIIVSFEVTLKNFWLGTKTVPGLVAEKWKSSQLR